MNACDQKKQRQHKYQDLRLHNRRKRQVKKRPVNGHSKRISELRSLSISNGTVGKLSRLRLKLFPDKGTPAA